MKALRAKAKELMHNKEDAEGLKDAKKQLKRLGECYLYVDFHL